MYVVIRTHAERGPQNVRGATGGMIFNIRNIWMDSIVMVTSHTALIRDRSIG